MYNKYHDHNMFWIRKFLRSPANLSSGLIICVSLYIIAPSLSALVFGNFEQRNWRYTTVGLINRGNDCFITSALQALAGIPRFVEYLNGIKSILQELNNPELKSFSRSTRENLTVDNIANDSRLENFSDLSIPLHESLMRLIADLVSVRESKMTISPKIVVNALESIFKSKMSSKQNDAHEFTMILLQTLQEEHSRLVKHTKHMLKVDVPNFPFEGETSKFLVCVQCNGLSKISHQKTFIRELSVPQKSSEKLLDILSNDETEIIEDYSCLICRARAILAHEQYRNFKDCAPDELLILDALKDYATEASINEDLPLEVDQYINHYTKDKFCISNVKGKVIKRDIAVKLPKVLVIHLSRSTFNGVTYSRNPCNVKFQEEIKLTEYTSIENMKLTENRQIVYNLKSVVKHTGSHSRGHYMCYRRKGDILFDKEDESFVDGRSIITNKNRNENITNNHGKRRYKRVKSASQYPYWQISDGAIKQKATSTVLNEQKYAYMLYYERVNK
ncbi:Ubp16p [Saccharomyces cerevisiae x Saccharomyces kudriavzevii VIN7]|uniref:Ubiquitin carboxyl-terminal hydrolase n=1 Tax=Saccharomyces cerevisiae x Saccharomyces kudriavzevii (strain VIN7) TaxID=1095631 RepID=H0H242_SACCK|nr:Ubp16p [Saccharomyces cerevisiae x Saccharomyces kudriavzevii VIN7]